MTTSVLKRPASGQGYSLGYAKRGSETLTFEVQALGLESVWDMGNSHVDLQEWVGLLLGDDRPAECLGTQKGFRFGFDFTVPGNALRNPSKSATRPKLRRSPPAAWRPPPEADDHRTL